MLVTTPALLGMTATTMWMLSVLAQSLMVEVYPAGAQTYRSKEPPSASWSIPWLRAAASGHRRMAIRWTAFSYDGTTPDHLFTPQPLAPAISARAVGRSRLACPTATAACSRCPTPGPSPQRRPVCCGAFHVGVPDLRRAPSTSSAISGPGLRRPRRCADEGAGGDVWEFTVGSPKGHGWRTSTRGSWETVESWAVSLATPPDHG